MFDICNMDVSLIDSEKNNLYHILDVYFLFSLKCYCFASYFPVTSTLSSLLKSFIHTPVFLLSVIKKFWDYAAIDIHMCHFGVAAENM